MKEEKVCINKTIALLAAVTVLVLGVVVFTNYVNTAKTSTDTRASADGMCKDEGGTGLSGYCRTDASCNDTNLFGLGFTSVGQQQCGTGKTCCIPPVAPTAGPTLDPTQAITQADATCTGRNPVTGEVGVLYRTKTNGGIIDSCADLGRGYVEKTGLTATPATGYICCKSVKLTPIPTKTTAPGVAMGYTSPKHYCYDTTTYTDCDTLSNLHTHQPQVPVVLGDTDYINNCAASQIACKPVKNICSDYPGMLFRSTGSSKVYKLVSGSYSGSFVMKGASMFCKAEEVPATVTPSVSNAQLTNTTCKKLDEANYAGGLTTDDGTTTFTLTAGGNVDANGLCVLD